jgi:hypothetical protein
MKLHQRIAYRNPCYLAEETLNPLFSSTNWVEQRYLVSLVFTANIGEE